MANILFEGYTDDLLSIDDNKNLKSTRLINLPEYDDDEIIDVCITSTSDKGNNSKFDSLLHRKIRVIIDVIS